MGVYEARVVWNRGDQPFLDKRYSRAHSWSFDGGAVALLFAAMCAAGLAICYAFIAATWGYGSIAAGFSMGYSTKEQDAGFIKVLVGENDKLLGVHVAGYQAAALIQPYVYLMNAYSGARYDSAIRLIQQSMTIHPSLSELTAWAFENY